MRAALSTWKRLRADRSGVVSYEYVIITAFMVLTAAAAYSTDAAVSIGATLTSASAEGNSGGVTGKG
jgi:hypothetical protein